jgi:murein DD-endopeptidase MepM/ murein hydrolase activator NlpD/outer membrane biosynthesis protein TonB
VSSPRRRWPQAVRRGALLLLVTCQLSLMPGWGASGALADEAAPGTGVEAAPEATEAPAPAAAPAPEEAEAPAATEPAAPGEPSEPPPTPPAPPPSEPPAPTPRPEPDLEEHVTPPTGAPPVQPSPAPPASSSEGGLAPLSSYTQVPPSPSGPAAPAGGDQSPTRHRGGAQPAVTVTGSFPQALAHPPARPAKHSGRQDPYRSQVVSLAPPAGLAEVPSDLAALLDGMPGGVEEGPPAFLIPIYKAAGRRFHVPWRVLAAINQVESDYGRNLSVSSAGAVGWMQFMPATWMQWGLDADHDGRANPYSPVDAIFTAARYLQASGAEADLAGAVFSYNHADWYVAEVLLRAKAIETVATFARVEGGYALPLEKRFMGRLGRTDDGVDIEGAPDGTLVYSITPGIVSAVASDPGGFGPNYPVVEATAGALAGRFVYYGHVALSLVAAGQHVAAGQPIAVVGHTGDAAALAHGHIEIGFSDAGGDPLSHHGVEAETPAGSMMRGVLIGLSAQFGVHNG